MRFPYVQLLSLSLITLLSQSYLQAKNTSGLVILEESSQIDVQNVSSSDLRIGISRSITYAIESEKGIEYLDKIVLPYDFDPTYIFHAPAARKIQKAFSVVDLDHYEAKHLNGKSITVKYIKQDYEMTTESGRYGDHDQYVLSPQDLRIGDTIQLSYAYSFPMDRNWVHFQSFRIFFHSTIPKKKSVLRIGYPRQVNVKIANYNGAIEDSIVEGKHHRQFIYKFKDLPPCLNEKGGRPYTELPYLILNVKPISFRYSSNNTFAQKELPAYSLLAYIREYDHLSMVQSIDQGLKLRQYRLFYDFMDELTERIEDDSTGYYRLKEVKKAIADSLRFENDIEYFKEWNDYEPRFGNDLSNGRIRDILRYETYIAVIRKLELGYFTAYISDKRCGVADGNFLLPMVDDDYFLATLTNDFRMHYIFPKRHDFGLYLDEFPFYHEHTKARMIHMKDYRSYARDINTQLRQIETPVSNFSDNRRTNHIMVNINTASGNSEFDARLTLSGQYSTLCRGSYTKNYTDPTINPNYGRKIWEMDTEVELKDSKLDQLNYEFPFKSKVNAHYSSPSLFSFKSDTATVKLSDLVSHVVNKIDCNEERHLDYYPDFMGSDTYVYMLKFDKEVELKNETRRVELKNEFGELIYSFEQLNAKTIKLSSFYAIKQSKLIAKEIDQFCKIQENWLEFNDQELELSLK